MKSLRYFYKITSPTNRSYVGQTVNITKRLASYRRLSCKNQPRLYRSLKFHTFARHTVAVLHVGEYDQTDANEIEEHYIKIHKAHRSKGGLNCRTGGSPALRPSADFKTAVSKGVSRYFRKMELKGTLEDYKAKQREGIRKLMRSVIQLTLDGEEVQRFESVTSAANHVGTTVSKIGDAIKGRGRKSTRGFKWAYA